MEVRLNGDGEANLPLNPEFEHAILVLRGPAQTEGRPLEPDTLHYFCEGRSSLGLKGERTTRLLLIGGRPFREPLLMWWNFVARTSGEIRMARDDWEQGRFGEVRGYPAARAEAPPMPVDPKT